MRGFSPVPRAAEPAKKTKICAKVCGENRIRQFCRSIISKLPIRLFENKRVPMSRNPIPEKAAVSPPSFPSFVPSIVATALLSLALGYWVGVGSSFLSLGNGTRKRTKRKRTADGGASASELSSEDDSEIDAHLDFPREECKLVSAQSTAHSPAQVLVVRTDLGMTKGKAVYSTIMTPLN